MIQVCVLHDGQLHCGGEELLERPGPRWVDVQNTTEAEMQRLAARYSLHRLAVEDCLHLDQRPKLEEYPQHLFVVLQGFSAGADVCDLTLHEHHFFIGPDWVISVHEHPFAGIEAVRRRLRAEPAATLGRGVDFVAYLLADALVDHNFPLLEAFSEELEDLETRIFEGPAHAQLQRIFALKRMLVTVRRVLSPQRDVVGLLARRGLPHVQERTTLYFRDVYDHLVRLAEQIDAGRDILGNAMDAYLSSMANRTADVTKQLTIFATLFLPLSFIVGFFGQNFDQLFHPGSYRAMWILLGAVPTALVLWFWHKGWMELRLPRRRSRAHPER